MQTEPPPSKCPAITRPFFSCQRDIKRQDFGERNTQIMFCISVLLAFFLSFFLPVFHSLSQIRNDKLNSKASLLQDAHQMTTLKSNQKKKSC